jgi:hypothetical protein
MDHPTKDAGSNFGVNSDRKLLRTDIRKTGHRRAGNIELTSRNL